MSVARIIIGILICLLALLAGSVIGLALGGYGICAVSISVGLVGQAFVIGGIFGGTVAIVWRSAWCAGALAFSVPLIVGLVFAGATGQWQRFVSLLICVIGTLLTAFVIRYPGPQSLKS